MRIGVDARTLRDDYPGIGRYLYNLMAAMQPQLEGDTLVVLHDPAVKSRYAVAPLAQAAGLELAECPLAPRGLSQQWKLPPVLRRLSLDVFFTPYYFTAYRGLPCPLVLTQHDLIPLVHPASMPSPLDRLSYRVAVGLAVRAARRIIVPSQATRADLLRLYAPPNDRVEVIPEAAAPAFSPAPETAVRRSRELLRVPQRYILHVGANKPHKNLETLLAAYHRYYTQAPAENRAALVLVGEHDPRYVTPRRWAAQLGLARSVLALGNVPDADLRALYSGATALAFPSLYEGFGLPVLEAMACGAPVLASSASSLPEVAGDAALLLEPGDVPAWTAAIGRVLDEPELRTSLREKGLARAAQFSWEKSARRTLEVLRSAR